MSFFLSIYSRGWMEGKKITMKKDTKLTDEGEKKIKRGKKN